MARRMPGMVETAPHPIPRPLTWAGLLGVWLVVCSASVRGAGSDNPVLPYDDTLKSRKGMVEGFLRDGQVPADKQEVFDDYITKYVVPQFVLPSNGGALRNVRDTFRKKLFLPAPPSAARQRLLELTVDGFNKILFDASLGKNFAGDDLGKWTAWTAAKVNVILALGELNETEGTASKRAKPLPAALPMLLEIAKPPAKATRGRDDSLRAAALIALERHADNPDIAVETRSKVRDAMLAIVEQRKPPAGRDAAVNDYLRGLAIDVLAMTKDTGPKNVTVVALDRIVNTPAEPIRLRGQAARALGNLEFPTGSNLDFKPLADHIGRLAVDVCKTEVERAQKAQNLSLNLESRRRLKPSIRDAIDGLFREGGRSGLITGATDPAQIAFVKKVIEKVKKVEEVLDKDVSGEVAVAKLAGPLKDLESVLEPRAEAPKLTPDEKPAEEAEALAGSPPPRVGAK
ncbi:MAG TPA: hypothetical protein VGG30_10970 [Pirellulales bacterium]